MLNAESRASVLRFSIQHSEFSIQPMDPLSDLIAMPALRGGVQIGALLLARLLPIMVMTPVFGGQTMPRRLRLVLAVAFTAGLLPPFYPLFSKTIPPLDYGI